MKKISIQIILLALIISCTEKPIKPKPKSRRNEPRHLPEVAKTIAEHTLNKVNQIAHTTSRNAVKLFNLPIKNITSF